METEGTKQVWTIGDVRVTRIVETVSAIPPNMLYPNASLETLSDDLEWLQPHFIDFQGQMLLSIHTFLVQSGDLRILVDTCVGNGKEIALPSLAAPETRFLEHIAEAGFPRESIDRVLCTHLHFDHVGWNTFQQDGKWVPTFPNARYLFGTDEWAYWRDVEDPFGTSSQEQAILPVLDAGLVDLVESTHEINEEVRLIPTPGHTPGHVSVEIQSRGESAVITGDLFHNPLGFAHPDWEDTADVDGKRAHASRVEFMKRFGNLPVLVLGTHFAAPTAGRIVSDGNAYHFEA